MMAKRAASPIEPQRAISSSVRPHPMQRPAVGSTAQEKVAIQGIPTIERFWLCGECSRKMTVISHPAGVLVVPLEQLGVVSISCRPTSHDGMSPCNTMGLTLRDGRTLPTYDWYASPTRDVAARKQ